MKRAPRCYASKETQDKYRAEIQKFGPVKYMVDILSIEHWGDRVQEYTNKLYTASRMLDKVAANLRHHTHEIEDRRGTTVDSATDDQLLDAIAERHGVDLRGKGDSSAH